MSLEVQYFPVLINKKEKIITAAEDDDQRNSNLEDGSLNLDKNEEVKEEEIEDEELELDAGILTGTEHDSFFQLKILLRRMSDLEFESDSWKVL